MPRKIAEPDPWVTVKELATELRVEPGTIYTWRYRGTGPAGCKIGGAVRYRRSVIDKWLVAQMELNATGLVDAGEQ